MRVDGLLQPPDDAPPAAGWPAVVFSSGFQGLKELIPGKFCTPLVAARVACFFFDCRGFGMSEGERGRVIPIEQVEDIRNAVTRIIREDDIDAQQLALIGWGFGGGIALSAAAEDSRVRAIVCLNGIGDGGRAVRQLRFPNDWLALQAPIVEDDVRQVFTGRSEAVSPWEAVPLNAKTQRYVEKEMYGKHERFGVEVTLRSAAAYYAFKPDRVADRINPRPLLTIHGQDDALHSIDEVRRVYAHARQPKRLVELPGAAHLDWTEPGHPLNAPALDLLTNWLHEALFTKGG